MDILGKLIHYLRKASPDFQFYPVHKKNCLTYIMYSPNLNQIIAVKFPEREHYISCDLAHKYLENTRLRLQKEFGLHVYQSTYILNILVSNRLTKSCFDLVTSGNYENMDMLFNPKRTCEKKILNTILHALATKFRNWSNKIKKSCGKTRSEYRYTSKGMVRVDKKIEPYGIVNRKIKDIEKAADILELISRKYDTGIVRK